jgi:3-methyl-2-oxobutanoate hydroxymethyltransferase
MYGPSSRGGAPAGVRRKVTVPEIRARKGGQPISMITAYDFTMARLLDDGGADLLLVGDSLGMVVQGHPTTLPVTVEEICYHGRAVARGARGAHVVGDMPFMSFQVSVERAIENAGRLVKDGCFESVKLEGGEEIAEHVRRIVSAGIPVMGHLGLTPQSVHAMGGFKVQGKDDDAALRMIDGARALEEAGAYAIVLEAIPPDLAALVTKAVSVPTIGIGAGASCDGQVLVCYDLLGMFPDLSPKFAKRFAEVGDQIIAATRAYVAEVQDRSFPAPEHCFKASGIGRRLAEPPAKTIAPDSDHGDPHASGARVGLPIADLLTDEIPPHWQTH